MTIFNPRDIQSLSSEHPLRIYLISTKTISLLKVEPLTCRLTRLVFQEKKFSAVATNVDRLSLK